MDDHTQRLTPRERDILRLIADGHANKQIARTLGISINTVRTHLHNVFLKLGAANRAEAVARFLTEIDGSSTGE